MRAMVIVGWAGFAGCAGDDEASTPGDFSPTLEFLAPADGASVAAAAGEVKVSIVVEDFALTAPDAQARATSPLDRSGLGSPGPLWLSLLPQALAHNEGGLPRGYCELSLDGSVVADLDATQYTLTEVATGSHELTGQLLFADGDPLDPPVSVTVTFTAE
ncbi:MAG: hypothetical protein ABMB14_15135 [Myxococcota bacterium]